MRTLRAWITCLILGGAAALLLALGVVIGFHPYLFPRQIDGGDRTAAPPATAAGAADAERGAAEERARALAELGALRADLAAPGADLAALRRRFEDLRRRQDAAGTDPEFRTVAAALDEQEANGRARAAWESLEQEVAVLLRESRYREALDRLSGFAPPASWRDGAALRDRRWDETRRAAEAHVAEAVRTARAAGAAGRLDEAREALRDARSRVPADLFPRLEEVERELAEAATRPPETGTPPDRPPDRPPDTPPSTPDASGLPPEVARAVAERQARFEAARRRLEERDARQEEEWRAMEERARSTTRAAPLELLLAGGRRLTGCRVSAFNRAGVTLEAVEGTSSFPWEDLPAAAACRIRRLGIDEENAGHQLELGKFCLWRDQIDLAERALRRAVELDPSLSARVPDVGKFRAAKRLFHGASSQVSAYRFRLRYDFDVADEAEDFRPVQGEGTAAGVSGGRLGVAGAGAFLVGLRDADFVGSVTLDIVGVQGSGKEPFVGFQCRDRRNREVFFGLQASAGGRVVVPYCSLWGGRPPARDAGPRDVPEGATLRIAFQGSGVRAYVQGKLVGGIPHSDFVSVRVILGGIGGEGPGSVAFDRVEVDGRVAETWLRKGLSELETLALRELVDDLEGLETGAAAPSEYDQLSVHREDRIARLDPRLWEHYVQVANAMMAKSASPAECLRGLNEVAEQAPDYPGTYYLRSRLHRSEGRPLEAEQDLYRSLERDPYFYEAVLGRADLELELLRDEEARADCEEALRLAPDWAQAHCLHAQALIALGRRREAERAARLANMLAPDDAGLRDYCKHVRILVRGPLWKRTYEAETEHYIVRSDIGLERAREYAEDLEAMARFWGEVCGTGLPPRKAHVLAFLTEEGFATYAEDMGSESIRGKARGFYQPWSRQIHLFDRGEDLAGTRRTLRHEGFHHFMHRLVPIHPQWIDEGMADYFSVSDIRKGKVVGIGVLEGRLRDLLYRLKEGWSFVPFDQVMVMDIREFYAQDMGERYAQGWSMVHFFLSAEGSRYRPLLRAYFGGLRAGKPWREVYDASFGTIDIREAEREWLAYVRKLGERVR